MKPVSTITTTHLFPELHNQLIELLRSLPLDAWEKPTVCTPWTVKEVVAHLLDGYCRRLSFQRDQLPMPPPETAITNEEDLINFLNQLNADWIKATKRLSPALLIAMLEVTGPALHQFLATLDPEAPAMFSVGWAGEDMSANWFDLAREYTEQWHHQQHIREAVGQPGLISRQFLYPVFDTFLRALPYTYRTVDAQNGTTITFEITGEAGGQWSLQRETTGWQLFVGTTDQAVAHVQLPQDIAWRLFTKGISIDEARPQVQIEGDQQLGDQILQMVSIMA
ncbi:MAG: maleylpyruvate isomerase family mycothiol-dependent enzyme [Chloroflexota bacterium]